MLPNPRGILFDLDGTLRHNDPDGASTFRQFTQEEGVELPHEQIILADRWTHHYFADSDQLQEDRLLSKGDEERFWLIYTRRYLQELGVPLDDLDSLAERVHQRMRTEYDPGHTIPADVFPTLEKLRARGIRIGVVTNRSLPVDDLMDTLGMNGRFDLVLTAGEAGVWKPDPRIFEMAVRALDIPINQTYFVGDNFYSDIQGSRGAGLQPILLDRRGLFPDPGCPVIQSIGEVLSLIVSGES